MVAHSYMQNTERVFTTELDEVYTDASIVLRKIQVRTPFYCTFSSRRASVDKRLHTEALRQRHALRSFFHPFSRDRWAEFLHAASDLRPYHALRWHLPCAIVHLSLVNPQKSSMGLSCGTGFGGVHPRHQLHFGEQHCFPSVSVLWPGLARRYSLPKNNEMLNTVEEHLSHTYKKNRRLCYPC